MTDLRELHRRALQVSVDVVDQVSPDQLALPTPCSAWNLGQLLAHMVGQNHGFAAAARGESKDAGIFQPRPIEADPAGLHAASAADLAAAFAEDGLLDRQVWLAEITAGPVFPAPVAISFHLVDSVAHAWDVAESIGVPVAFDPEVLQTALAVSRRIPDAENRLEPGSAFAPGAVVEPGAAAFEEILALLGRSPDWRG
ncbi:MAG TPA: TIGR03086 family metal-binding protein [Actinocrinis sp.]|nr:TIGR03086 family metal-binding protein [Actinocrinis sp.]